MPSRLSDLGFYEGPVSERFGEAQREALEEFRSTNNFENHTLSTLEDALAKGWDTAAGSGKERMIDAIWHGLKEYDRQ